MHCFVCLHWNLSGGHVVTAHRVGSSSLPSLHCITPSQTTRCRKHRPSHTKPLSSVEYFTVAKFIFDFLRKCMCHSEDLPLKVQLFLTLHGPSSANDSSSLYTLSPNGQSLSPSHTFVSLIHSPLVRQWNMPTFWSKKVGKQKNEFGYSKRIFKISSSPGPHSFFAVDFV